MSAAAALPESLNFATVREVLGRSEELLATGRIDLSGVQRADSAGVALLLELTRRAAQSGKPLVFTGAAEHLRQLSRFFGVDSLLKFQ